MASDEKIPGPYWISQTVAGEHLVCGRHGAVMFRYPADQKAAADAHVKQLQRGFKKAEKAIRAAAPDLYAALKAMVLNDTHTYRDCHKAALAALAKAESASA